MNSIQLLSKDKRSRVGVARFEKKKISVWFLNHVFKCAIGQKGEPFCLVMHKYFSLGRRQRRALGLPRVALICKLTGRPRSVLRLSGLSRTIYKNSVHRGMLVGVSRAA